jgi:hypothetical protein
MEPHDPLELDTLPADPRIAALGLLGMATSELRELDGRIVGGRSSIGGIKTDVNKIVKDLQFLIPTQPQQTQPHQQIAYVQSTPTQIDHAAISMPQIVQPGPEQLKPQHDPNQLEFDFYKKIKPEDLELQLKNLNTKVNTVISKIDKVIEILTEDKKKLN